MTARVCPYSGLRPFTEEESIFFKGRDLHIRQIVKLLEENKMAFITGASGDGKSSMVYAGVVPYIRAGFFKAQFNNWIIADFKPQKKSATHKYRFYALPLVAERQLFSSFPFTVKSYNKIQHNVKEQNLEEIFYTKNNSTYLQHCPFCQ